MNNAGNTGFDGIKTKVEKQTRRKYKETQKLIREKIFDAKELWMTDKCE